MTEDDVVRVMRAYIEGLFPKVCSNCGRCFATLRDYLQSTTHVGMPILYDSLDEGIPADPLGPLSHADCRCGTTLTIGSDGIPTAQMIELLTWARHQAAAQSIDVRGLLQHLRDRIDHDVFEDGATHGR